MTLVGPRGAKGFSANLIVTREALGEAIDVADYAGRQLAEIEAALDSVTVLDERAITHRGAPGFQRLHRFKADGDWVQQAQTFVLSRGVVWVATCSAALQDFDALAPAFRQMVDSLEVVPDAE